MGGRRAVGVAGSGGGGGHGCCVVLGHRSREMFLGLKERKFCFEFVSG